MGEDNFNGRIGVLVGNDDFCADGGGEALLALDIQGGPQSCQIAGFLGYGIDREVANGKGRHFALNPGEFGAKLFHPLLERGIQVFELFYAHAPGHVEVEELFGFRANALQLTAESADALLPVA